MRFLLLRALLVLGTAAPAVLAVSVPFIVGSALESGVHAEVAAVALMDSMEYEGSQVVPVAWSYDGHDFTALVSAQLDDGMAYAMPVDANGFQASTLRGAALVVPVMFAVIFGVLGSFLVAMLFSMADAWDKVRRRAREFSRERAQGHLQAA